MESSGITKTLLVMRLTALILLVGCLQVTAKGFSQATITLSEKNASLEDVLAEIGRQSGYKYFFADQLEDQARRVSIEVSKTPLEEVLDICFRDQPFTYSIFKKTIVIRQKKIDESKFSTPSILPKISGIIRNDKLEPLAGASVSVVNLDRGTYTNDKGIFELTNIPAEAKIEVSYTGYQKKDFLIQGKLYLELILPMSNSSLDQVQVIAYGTTTQRFNTGDVTTVKGADIEKQPVGNALLALEGRVPGLEISQATGLSGGNVNVLIRGGTSIANGNDPFYVIDGIPYPSQLLPNLGGNLNSVRYGTNYNPTAGVFGQNPSVNTFGSPLNYLNPSDIESISVLKDAAATAIYGSRAANGAIIITTKHGKAGETRVDINLQNGWGGITRKLDLMNTQQYLIMRHEAIKNDGLSIDPIADYDLNGTWDTTRNTDWQKKLIGGTSQYLNLNATVSGGNSSTQYTVGGNFHRESSVFPNNFANQNGDLHFNINTHSSNEKFGLNITGTYMVDDNQLPSTDLTNAAITLAPVAPPLYNADDQLNWAQNSYGSSTWYNPLAYLYNRYQNKTNNLIGNLVLNYHILPELEIRSSFGYSNLQANEVVTYPLLSQFPEMRQINTRAALYGNNNNNDWIIEPQINYKHKIGKGRLETLIGATIHQNNSHVVQLLGYGYNSDQVLADIASAVGVLVQSTLDAVYKYNALFGRVDYNWQEKYIIDLTIRRDGSSRFGFANQFHNFGAIGFAWIFSKEKFIEEHLPFISFGKFRTSYGTTGNDQIGNYQFLNLYSPVNVGDPYQGVQGLRPTSLTNPYLEWEETRKLEFGADIGLSKDRILLSGSYYRNRSSNQLLNYTIPVITGFTSVTQNFPATVQNSGLEFSLHTVNAKGKDFEWSTNINLSIPRNELVAFPTLSTSGYSSQLVIGKPTNIAHMYHFLGVNPTTGIYQFGDGKAGATSAPDTNNALTATSLVDLNPSYYGGMENSFRYRGFDLDISFQFVKQIGLNYFFGTLLPGTLNGGQANQPNYLTNRWQQVGMVATHQRYNSDYTLSGQFYDAVGSDAAYSNASFIRLKNLSLSWSFPEAWMKRAHLRNFKVYVRGQNLLTISHYLGLDPETRSLSTLPPLRVLTAGVQVGL